LIPVSSLPVVKKLPVTIPEEHMKKPNLIIGANKPKLQQKKK
jgi:hypothetical protein